MLILMRCLKTAKHLYCSCYFLCLNLMNYLSVSVRFNLDSVFIMQQISESIVIYLARLFQCLF